MSKRDYYEVLGVSRSANASEIKKAYRSLAMKHHPDRTGDDPKSAELFKEANEAYSVLSDDKKKSVYDQYGHAGLDPNAGGGGFGPGDFGDLGDVFGDFFGDFFGGGAGQRQQHSAGRGSDLRYDMVLELKDAVHGVTKEIKVPRLHACEPCKGFGTKSGKKPPACSECGGTGQIRRSQGFLMVQQPCRACRGQGIRVTDPCTSCRGQGRVQKTKTLSVKIPAGIDTGDQICLKNEGESGVHGGPSGDLYVRAQVKEHPIFSREGANLHCDLPISFTQAALGAEIEVPTLDGKVKLKIPSETQTGKMFRLRGKGMPFLKQDTMTGDLMCCIIVETPVRLTSEQKDMLREFAKSVDESSSRHFPKWQDWFQGVKKFLTGD